MFTRCGSVVALLTESDGAGTLLLGDDFLPWIVLALGAAMVVGNLLALLKPPNTSKDGSKVVSPQTRPQAGRIIVMIVIGAIAAIWGAASLLN